MRCDFLRCCGTCFTDVVTGDRNCIPFWNVLRTIFEDISDRTHGRFWRENVSTASCILFQNIIFELYPSIQWKVHLVFSYCDIHCQQNRRWSVDCHGCGYFAKVDAVEQDFHIFQRSRSQHLLYQLRLPAIQRHQSHNQFIVGKSNAQERPVAPDSIR